MRNQTRLLIPLLLFVVAVLPNNSEVIAQSNEAGAPQPPMAEKKTKEF